MIKFEEKKKIILDFIKSEKFGVVATVNDKGNPQSATMSISQTDNLELIFQTPNNSRKYKNLKINPNVSITFGFSLKDFTTVQFEGIAKEVKEDKINDCRRIHVKKNPYSENYAYLPENKYFLVSPKWIRYWDFNKDEKIEMTF